MLRRMLIAYGRCGCAGIADVCFARPAGGRPNVLLIVTDDQGWGDVGIHGNDKIRTPNLDRLAREGAPVHALLRRPGLHADAGEPDDRPVSPAHARDRHVAWPGHA